MEPRDSTLVLYSRLAFYPVHWLALEEIVSRYAVRAVVFAAPPPTHTPTVHAAHGRAGPGSDAASPIEIRAAPPGTRRARLRWLAGQLRDVRPDVIWVQEEPIDPLLLELLLLHRFGGSVRIVSALCENIFPRPSGLVERTARRLLWPRLDGLAAVATASIEGIRAAGMPESVPAWPLVSGGLAPGGPVEPVELPFERSDGEFVVGFAGRLVEEKGWKVLARALPHSARLAVAGDGPQRAEVESLAASDPRIHYVGLLPKGELWSFYAAVDCLAVPSLTTARWKEQFGGVLTDAMVMGLPIVGSSSGAIPEVMGDAGLLVPEGDVSALADAIGRLHGDAALRARLGATGRERFASEFAIPSYADKLARVLGLRARSFI